MKSSKEIEVLPFDVKFSEIHNEKLFLKVLNLIVEK